VTVASLLGPDKPETKIWARVQALLDERLPGRFRLRVIGNATLGGEKEVAEGVRLGSVQASLCTASVISAWAPEVQLLDLPFMFRDRAHVRATLDGPLGAELAARLAAQQFVVPAYIIYGARQLLAKEPLSRPAQLAGKRIRVIQSPLHVELWRSFGADPTAIPIPETYNALRTGVVDMMDLTKSAYAGFKLYEVVPYLTETSHVWATGIVYYGAAFWDGLSPDEQAALAGATREGAAHFDTLVQEDEATSMERARAAGASVVPAEERAAWEAGARRVWASVAPEVGGMARIESVADGAG
jgi:tripartite ATP-independent transporter DctP family solute receptor